MSTILISIIIMLAGLNNNDEVIIGGMPAKRGQFPHQGAMFYRNNFRCGCSLLTEEYVITAAHCTVR